MNDKVIAQPDAGEQSSPTSSASSTALMLRETKERESPYSIQSRTPHQRDLFWSPDLD